MLIELSPNDPNRFAFRAELPKLRAKLPAGYYALFVGASMVGAYATYSDALTEGYNTAGKAPFFVKQVNSSDEVQCVVSPFTTS
jgi:hypothetical protein